MTTLLYVVAADSNIRDGIVEFANVGQTDRTVEERLRDGDYARKAGGGHWNILAQFDITGHADHDIHSILRKRGFIINPRKTANTEEVRFDLKVQDVIDLVSASVNELIEGVDRPDSYEMRPEQEACVAKAVAAFERGTVNFLVNAKMRFGKTHVSYRIAKALAANNVLVLTSKPAVQDEWRNSLERHVAFKEMSFHRVEEGGGTPGVYFASMQGLYSDNRSDENGKRDWIYDRAWDLVILDEEHYGSRTERAGLAFERIQSTRWLRLSGTPFQALMSNEFGEDEMFTWSYIDEQEAKAAWAGKNNPYDVLPRMKFMCLDIGPTAFKEAIHYSEDEQFRMRKFFGTDLRGFINTGRVNELLDILAGRNGRNKWSPWNLREVDDRMLDNTLWLLPSVEACNWMERTLRDHGFFNQFDIINVAGDNETCLDRVKDRIAFGSRTITLSRGRFTTGVTVPEWGAVFFLDDGKSPTTYYQTAFRAQSPWVRAGEIFKRECYVFDINPHRVLEMTYTQAIISARNGEFSVNEFIKRYLDCAPVFFLEQTEVKPIDVSKILDLRFDHTHAVLSSFSNVSIDVTAVGEGPSAELMNITPLKAAVIKKVITETDVERGKILEGQPSKEALKEAKKAAKMLRERIQKFLCCLPDYLYVTPMQENSCRDILLRGDAEIFLDHTGLSLETFRSLLESHTLNEDHLNNCIVHFNYIENRIPKLI
jgi:hypothetical protein